MNDPHVVSLHYRLDESIGLVRYTNPFPVSWNTPIFNAELVDSKLTVKMNEHFASVSEAKGVVDQYLRRWEVEAALQRGLYELLFQYERADVIDREPSDTLPTDTSVRISHLSVETLIGIHTRTSYPSPPTSFQLTANVEMMWQRYRGYLAGREPLSSMAYFCLTVIESEAAGRKKASQKYNVHIKVLSKLGELTARQGDPATARKMGIATPMTDAERIWIEQTVRVLILRMGEYDPQNPMSELTMRDLPPLI
jgi:hypothetical protein